VGQFKRGKSTLLNALDDDAALPAGVVPLTSVITVVRYDAAPSAGVRLDGGSWADPAGRKARARLGAAR